MNQEQQTIFRRMAALGMVQQTKQDKNAVFMVALSPDQMQKLDTAPLTETLDLLLMDAETVRSLKNRLTFDWTHFRGEKREADEIPFVRRFFEIVSEKFPFWFWFVSKETYDINLKWIFYCLSQTNERKEFGRKGQETVARNFSNDEIMRFMTKYAGATRQLQEQFNLSDAETKESLKQTEQYYRRFLTGFDWSQMPGEVFN